MQISKELEDKIKKLVKEGAILFYRMEALGCAGNVIKLGKNLI